MRTNILSTAIALSDQDLLSRIGSLASEEREATAQLVAHLAALELRPSLYAAQGYGSLFDYCTRALGLSEDAACSRTSAARTCRRFPAIVEDLASGTLSLTSVRLLAPHLTAENHEVVLARPRNKARGEIQALVAELAPRPDVPASVRKLPEREIEKGQGLGPLPSSSADEPVSALQGTSASVQAGEDAASEEQLSASTSPRPTAPAAVEVLSPRRYRVQFTIGQEAHDQLQRVQALLRREIPNGDPGVIFERALALLAREVEKAKLGRPSKPPRRLRANTGPGGAYETRIRFETDEGVGHERRSSRYIPRAVKRAVWYRDRGLCALVSESGRRCAERNFLELHHIQRYALDGPATVENISLRCRRHNQYEAEIVFGPREPSVVREAREGYWSGSEMA